MRDPTEIIRRVQGLSTRRAARYVRGLKLTREERQALVDCVERNRSRKIGARRLRPDEAQALKGAK